VFIPQLGYYDVDQSGTSAKREDLLLTNCAPISVPATCRPRIWTSRRGSETFFHMVLRYAHLVAKHVLAVLEARRDGHAVVRRGQVEDVLAPWHCGAVGVDCEFLH
jgi:hypothetical protein